MSYIEQSLSDGENIVAIFRLHWVAWIPAVLWVVFTLGIGLPVAFYLWLKLRFTEHGVTNRRVILKTGIIGRRTEEMKLASMETVEIEQGIWGRILNFGTVKITGRGLSDLVFSRIADPLEVKRKIESVSHVAGEMQAALPMRDRLRQP